jgi:hemerythrin
MYFEWNSQIELGHPLLDEQHKRLFSLSEAVAETLAGAPDRRPVEVALRALIDFVRVHFATEDGLMRAADFPDADEHASSHALLLAELDEYCRKVQREENTGVTVTGLVAFLWNWLITHINAADRELVIWLRSREPRRGV